MNVAKKVKINLETEISWRFHLCVNLCIVTFYLLSFVVIPKINSPFLAGRFFGLFAVIGFLSCACAVLMHSARTGIWWTSGAEIFDKPMIKKEKLLAFYGVVSALLCGILGAVSSI